MRPVERPRKQARASAKAKRGSARVPRASAPRGHSGRRGKRNEGALYRLWRAVSEKLAISRPMLMMSAAFLATALLAGLFIGGYVGRAIHWTNSTLDDVASDAGFGITSVHLSGNRRTPPRMILAALGFQPGQSIFGANLQAARARLTRLSWVADAQVSRTYPDSISVSLVEKLPFALWESTHGLYVVERSGAPIVHVQAAAFPHLPLFVGDVPKGGADLVDAISTHTVIAAHLRAMQRVSGRRWNLLLDDGVIVKLPEQNWQKQLDALETLIADKGVLTRDIGEIDLRSPDNYFFKLRGGPHPPAHKRPKESAA
ncbi:MAG TPA: FtsQ-type POTRA domain-containing protein [Rhizomicrobium sp.]|nr:FtsQ-type POTRA domain-containing protein [Rhizomicrobium sp.]